MQQELLLKVREAINEPIVGNYLFTSHELEEIFARAGQLLQSQGCVSEDEFSIVFVALVNITKTWNSEEDAFLDYIYRKFSSNYNAYQAIYSNLRSTISWLFQTNKIYMIEWGKRFYSTLCSHALAPINSTFSFFDMCWEIYCNDLDQQYDKNDPVFGLIASSLKNKFSLMNNLDDDIKIGSTAYSMRVGLKGLAIHATPILEKLINETICCINSLFNNQPIKNDKYFKILLGEWWDRKQLIFGTIKRNERQKRERVVSNYSLIKAKYILENNIVNLSVPSFRLLDNYDIKPVLRVFIDGELIHNEELNTHGSGIIMSTSSFTYPLIGIDIQNCDIQIIVSHCGKDIYDSRETLNRDYILFKNGKEVLSSECLPGQYQVYSSSLDVFLRAPLGLEKNGSNIYSFEAIDGEIIQSTKKTTFFFSEQIERKLYFYVKKKSNVVFRENDTEYQVIDGELCVDVINSNDANHYGVRYEDASFKLSDFPHTSDGEKTRYEITNLLNVGQPQRIAIFRYDDNSILSNINVVKFNNVSITFDKKYYYGDNDTGKVVFKTDKYFGESTFDISADTISIPIEDGDLIIEIPIVKWKIGNEDWKTGPSNNDYWFKSIPANSLLFIKVPNGVAFSMVQNDSFRIEKHVAKHIYELGSLIKSLSLDHRFCDDSYSIQLKTEDNEILTLFNIIFTERFYSIPLLINHLNYTINWNPRSFVGDDDSLFKIVIFEDGQIVDEFDATLKPKVINCNNFDEGKYEAKVYLHKSNNFNKELYFSKFIFGDEKNVRFKHRAIYINTVATIDMAPYTNRIKPIFIDKIGFLGSKDGFDYYSGYLFIVDKNGQKIYLDKMRDNTSKISTINPIRIELKTDYSCYIGYGLDLTDPDFEYDNEFSVDYLGRTVIGNYVYGKKTLPIDYYIFEIIPEFK